MDIYRISIPLVLGALSACILAGGECSSGSLVLTQAAIPPLALCGTGFLWMERRSPRAADMLRNPLFWEGVFFLLGFWLFALDLQLPRQTGTPPFLESAHSRLLEAIGSIPMSDDGDTALAKAIIAGDRSGMQKADILDFRRAGAAHLLALSGMHLGIIYLVVKRIFAILGGGVASRRIRSGLTITLTGLYTLLCGCGASLVRAWLFILIAETGLAVGRRQDARQVFCTALTIHLILHPSSIADIGFQLSYLAMAGIVFLWPHVKCWYNVPDREDAPEGISRLNPGRKIWEAASLSICCQLFTAPLTLIHFGTFPKYFLITNLLATPLMTVAMVGCISSTGLFCCFGDGISPTVYRAIGYPLHLLRELIGLVASIS